MDALPITLCISTRNAAEHLESCIASARPWVSEIVVVDMESDDTTCEIARAAGATVVAVPAAGWAEPGRQSGIQAASQPWILVLDADERAGPELGELAAGYVKRDDLAGVWLPRQNFQFGWWLRGSGIWPDWQLRLFRRQATTWPGDRTHVGPQVSGSVERAPARTENAIIHHSFSSISAWVTAANRYTDLEAEHLSDSSRPASVTRLVTVPTMRFAELYFVKRGYRSGRYGLTVALLSFCYWLLAELKLWERRLRAESLPRDAVRQPRI
ncbi:MAG TPA: glycosyltransferase family 2 protein [Solirubrobacteraceae bacterium]